MRIHPDWKIKEIDNENIRFALSYSLKYYQKRLQKIGFTGKDTKILDAGCGAGHWSIAASYLNSQVQAIDLTKKYLAMALKINSKIKRPNVCFQLGKLEKLPFPNNYFDYIICYNVWMYTHKEKSIQELYRVLKPDGKIYLGCLAGIGWYLNLMFQAIWQNKRYLFFDSLRALKRRIPVRQKEAERLLQKQKFKLLAIGYDSQIGKAKIKIKPQYLPKFLGFWNVYEALAQKPK